MSTMRAAVLHAPRRMEVRSVPAPEPQEHEVLLRPCAVGVCGTDTHIYAGSANYNTDADGRCVPLETHPQILGHEIVAEVLRAPAESGLREGQRVVVDQGLNCCSRQRKSRCLYCASGNSHHCFYYREHGITGLPGGFAERMALAWVNVLPLPATLAVEHAACAEPLACVLHALEVLRLSPQARFAVPPTASFAPPSWWTEESGEFVETIAICGGGTAGQMFVQALRNVIGFKGRVLLSDPSPRKRALAIANGAEALDATKAPFDTLVRAATADRGAEMVIEASGAGAVFEQLPGAMRRQGTMLLYAHGHGGAPLSALNNLHWLEPTLLLPNGASGRLDAAGRPLIYMRALAALESGAVRVDGILSRSLHGLEQVDAAIATPLGPDECKRVVLL